MERITEIHVGDVESLTSGSLNPVLAWARDVKTGAPVYILELDKTRTGSKCGCECASCNLPLTAVNAAKTEYIRRPHFRHPDGAEKSACMYLAARLAAMQLLQCYGEIDLPRRRVSGRVMGLSGYSHEAWVEHPAERVKIRHFDFRDKAAAILTLDDGRILHVNLVGSGPTLADLDPDPDATPFATISLEIPDPAIAAMSPSELRSRITLIPDNFCWVSHWHDRALQVDAQSLALELADDALDLAPLDGSLDGVEIAHRRETLLHLEVKNILAELDALRVPELFVEVTRKAASGQQIRRQWARPSELISIIGVQLEHRMGGVIPDVVATVPSAHGSELLVEVTVTNRIDDERIRKIKQLNLPALEIDLSASGGRITRAQLKNLVCHNTEIKRWLHHPDLLLQVQLLTAAAEQEIAALDLAATQKQNDRALVLATPVSEIARDYLDAIFAFVEFERHEALDAALQAQRDQARQYVVEVAAKLALHGFPEAGDPLLASGRGSIIPRILSIRRGLGVGYRLNSTMEVMNAIRQSFARNSTEHSIYLIAEKVYRPPDAAEPLPGWYLPWVQQIRDSLEGGEPTYLRDGRFDRLLSLLFPEMASGLANGYGKIGMKLPRRSNATATENFDPMAADMESTYRRQMPRTAFSSTPKRSDKSGLWLEGEELEQWRRNNPEYAKGWAQLFKKD